MQHVQKVCGYFNLTITLVDEDFLNTFLELEVSHRMTGVHDHEGCHLFCKLFSLTFMVEGDHLAKVFYKFMDSLRQNGFVTSFEEDYDKREESMEIRHGRKRLVYHIFAETNDTIVHIVVVYRWNRYWWNNQCNPQTPHNTKWHPIIAKKSFCRDQHLLIPFESTKAYIDAVYVDIPQYIRSYLAHLKSSTFRGCNYNQARLFYSTYGYDASPASDQFRAKARKLLATVTRLLGNLKIQFWLSSGTCLGWFRQCDFIPHSKDVDIGIWISDYNNRLIPTFQEHGIFLKHLFGTIEDSYELSFQSGDMKLDIFFFYTELDHMWNGGTQARTGKKFKYIFPSFSLCWTLFKGLYVRIPCDTLAYISANYGKNWGEVVKIWDWKKSPPNVHENGEWPIEERGKVIQSF